MDNEEPKEEFVRDVFFERKEDYESGRCGKKVYDKKTAQTKRNFLMNSGKEKYMRIYPCKGCNGWHLTSQKFSDYKNN